MGREVKRPYRTGWGEKPDTPKPQPPKVRLWPPVSHSSNSSELEHEQGKPVSDQQLQHG